ncbi:MAG: phosphotransferase [Ilumatobacteraceae bacterium]|nr:phosphotransferase [Ilumatobacteraceae bacterium]
MSDLPLIGRGRAADVFDAGNGRVLRRYRTPHPGLVEREAVAMRHLRANGAPVPEVFSAEDDEIVMERINGRSMMDVLTSKPWRAAAIGRQLADVQRRIHAVPAGDLDLPRFSDGNSILHFDLHPDNVMLTDGGPVVIDWSNVAVGDPLADVMFSWMLMSTGEPDQVPMLLRPIVRRTRQSLVAGFMEGTPTDEVARGWVSVACERRLTDPNTTETEKRNIHAFATS